jgi:hypothetical protein
VSEQPCKTDDFISVFCYSCKEWLYVEKLLTPEEVFQNPDIKQVDLIHKIKFCPLCGGKDVYTQPKSDEVLEPLNSLDGEYGR